MWPEPKENDIIDFLMMTTSAQQQAGWYDWFCDDRRLASKTVKLVKLVKQIIDANYTGGRFKPKETYVLFKNNRPVRGILYDDFRICRRDTGDVLFTIVPRTGHAASPFRAEVWDVANFKGRPGDLEPAVVGCWRDVLNFFQGFEAKIDTDFLSDAEKAEALLRKDSATLPVGAIK